ncbi:OCIA domain-containing protein 1-like [Xyrichtys novacula]|uniref:OCIA domain-containing protein 1 n=1 Tax=Xyrichtys novacula TaxID=13765 RepID=A0AAV1ETK8_XYRNO|nr:OCIA domain-containing protein 1-like [Xyrichtys novacula]
MSSTSTDFTEDQQSTSPQTKLGGDYVISDEERMVFKECNYESFWYRSVPLTVTGIAVTHALVSLGLVAGGPRLGSLPKATFVGFFGYMLGKVSYIKNCEEKFMRLDNSPLGEALRVRKGLPREVVKELSDPSTQSFNSMFQPADTYAQRDVNPDPPTQMGRAEDINAPVQSYLEEEEPKRKSILYEDLRLKNRENYEVTLTQKAETLLKPPPEKKEPTRVKKEMKNIYGDTWEE